VSTFGPVGAFVDDRRRPTRKKKEAG